MRGMEYGAELGAKTYVFWGGREGTESDATKNPVDAINRFRDAINFVCEYARSQQYDLRFALEAKPNEPRGDIYLPTSGHMLAFIQSKQSHSDEWSNCKIERLPCVLIDELLEFDFAITPGDLCEIQRQHRVWCDHLNRLAGFGTKRCAQTFVAIKDRVQTRLKRLTIQPA